MLTIEKYRKIGKKQKKLRNWVIIFLTLLFSFVLTSGVYKIMELLKVSNPKEDGLLANNIIIKGNEVILKVSDTNYDLSSNIDRIRQVLKKINASQFSIYNETKPIVKTTLTNPEVVVLNGKGERNLAMNVSVIMITNGMNVINYGNAKENVKDSFIIVRAPVDRDYINKISSFTGITNIKVMIDSDILPSTMAPIIVILGKDYILVK